MVEQERELDLDAAYFGRPIRWVTCYLPTSDLEASKILELIKNTTPLALPAQALKCSTPVLVFENVTHDDDVLVISALYLWELEK